MIYGNKIGGSSEQTYLIEDGGVAVLAILADEADVMEPNACCEDVKAGKVFVGANGLQVGTNDLPSCRVISGAHEVAPGVDFVLRIEKAEQWNYTTLHGIITYKNTPYKVEMLIMDNAVYNSNGDKISDITKDRSTHTIRFNIKNETAEPQLLHFFVCKEEM